MNDHHSSQPPTPDTDETFSTDTTGLDETTGSAVVDLADGDTYDLRIAPVAKQIGTDRVRMLAYNGSIPGPTLRVRQDAEITVRVRNDADTEATVHWHGLRRLARPCRANPSGCGVVVGSRSGSAIGWFRQSECHESQPSRAAPSAAAHPPLDGQQPDSRRLMELVARLRSK
jgi:hypothetical protein